MPGRAGKQAVLPSLYCPTVTADYRPSWPAGYLITFSCYGKVVHGDARPTVDRDHNLPGQRFLPENSGRAMVERRLMKFPPYVMDLAARRVVLSSILQVCEHHGWGLIGANVLKDHVHVVDFSEAKPEKVMNDLKVHESRVLNQTYGVKRPYWGRHGSTRWLWRSPAVRKALEYVVEGQGSDEVRFVPI